MKMKTKTKRFDALQSKHAAAKVIRKATRGMTVEEEVAYWAAGTEKLLERQEAARQRGESA